MYIRVAGIVKPCGKTAEPQGYGPHAHTMPELSLNDIKQSTNIGFKFSTC